MSDTPRTDTLISDKETFCFEVTDLKPAHKLLDFAKKLERECNSLQSRLDALEKVAEGLDEALKRHQSWNDSTWCMKNTALAAYDEWKACK